ncbi:hypothetical protein IAI10_11305 [Clostridium sp. 19966]|uniref:hypothetical protein n=1 Tax=Clostridium sp. 19966 TaxID=2768166 RepID=UPI0028DEFCEE|nr:hypothetical protein [Clostridium sp. 19966]MDT8717245.1 hypothetical protein [Clostridium sp. 19966]
MEEDFFQESDDRQAIPGTTAASVSPGSTGYPAESPTPIYWASGQQTNLSQTEIGLYTQGYLMTQIGKQVRIQFLLGENNFEDRRGQVLGVGIDYVLLRERGTNDVLMCDLYSIKFVVTYL